MFGRNLPWDVHLTKGRGQFFGFTLRGSHPAFVVALDPDGQALKQGIRLGDHVRSIL